MKTATKPAESPAKAENKQDIPSPDEDAIVATSVAPYDLYFDGLANVDLGHDEHEEAIPDNQDAQDDYFALPLPDDEIDLEDLLKNINARTRSEKVMLFLAAVFSVVTPILFISGLIQFPFFFMEFYAEVMSNPILTCEFPYESLIGIIFDTDVARIEGVRSTIASIFITIGAAIIAISYQGIKKCSKRSLTNELVAALEEKNVANADLLRSYEFSAVKMQMMLESIQQNGLQKDMLERIKEKPSRCEQFAINIQSFRHECMRYFKFLVVAFTIPGLIMWADQGDSLDEKIDCDKSTVFFSICTPDKDFEQMSLVVYPYMTGSLGVATFLTSSMLLYFFVTKNFAKKFYENVHLRILKFFSLRDEDKDKWLTMDYIWARGWTISLPFLTWFSLTRAYRTTQGFADISNCAGLFAQVISVATGIDMSTPDCPRADATLLFGEGTANLEIVHFYPLYFVDEALFFTIAFLLLQCSLIKRFLTDTHMKNYLKEFNRIHERALKAGYITVLLIGVPLFVRAVQFVTPILLDGISQKKHYDNLTSYTNATISTINASLAQEVCPYDSANFLDQLRQTSISDLSNRVKYLGDGTFEFIIAEACPQYADYASEVSLYGLVLASMAIKCKISTYMRFFESFIGVYWAGVSLGFGSTYILTFYSGTVSSILKACRSTNDVALVEEAKEMQMAELPPSNDNVFVDVSDEKKQPLLLQDQREDNFADDERKYDEEAPQTENTKPFSGSATKNNGRRLSFLWQPAYVPPREITKGNEEKHNKALDTAHHAISINYK